MDKKVSFLLDDETHARIKAKAKSKNMTLASYVKFILFSSDELK
uniref:Plasmid copy number control protein n=1 Tax=Mycoplasma capricolum subsp. capricolum TaxID=40479 RepID=K9RYD0_MYCCA|nr:hypothetical protein [Mycoplasma capricolum]AFY63029.1 plasmid copy number control protein [Mycoplasma capricolum subsp. capricolum]